MQETSISFKTARLAGEKGISLKEFSSSGVIIDKANIRSVDDNDYAWICKQPLLQKILREIYKIEVLVYCNASGWMWELNKAHTKDTISGGTHICWSDYSGPNEGGHWDTYEEALEEGLYKALKLI